MLLVSKHRKERRRTGLDLRVASFLALACLSTQLLAQSNVGELRLRVMDPDGLGLQSSVELVSEANQLHRAYVTDPGGTLEAKMLPFGLYRLRVTQESFQTYSVLLEIRSAVPAAVQVSLSIAPTQTTVEVNDSDTLVDPHRIGTVNRVGQDAMEHSPIAMPGRTIIDLVNSQPGWLLESNGTLHPRGSEEQTQYVVDGVPLTDNRSAAFAPEIEADDIESMTILTASFPAEYGRKLGGVVEVSTIRDARSGLHAKAVVSGGSFGTAGTYLMTQYGWGKNTLGMSAGGAVTSRYLDPPALENFNNHSTSNDLAAHYERDFNDHDRLGVALRHEQAIFQVPNELLQEAVGQRQHRGSFETMGILSYQHIFSPDLLGDIRLMSRDVSTHLVSNDMSTPIIVGQQRGFREGYVKGSLAWHHGIHEVKAGVEVDYGSLHERFNYVITDLSQFDAGTPPTFSFSAGELDREQALYAQDLVRLGRWTLSAGVRWDHYQLVVEKSAISPRLGIAWHSPRIDTIFHLSYDRIFQTPAFENILLASSPAVVTLNPQVLRVPVQPSSGNFYEVGLTKGFFGKLRLDANYYQRFFHNYADDDVLLNTGISVPIAFREGKIHGAEVKLEAPHWGRVSAYLSYSYLVGFGYTPVTGGIFIGNDVTTALSTSRFPVSQDQRNTVSTRVRVQIAPRVWGALGGSYGSGLPTEFDGTIQDAMQRFDPRIVDRINFVRGRVKPSLSLDATTGVDLLRRDNLVMSMQTQVQNFTNRLNVINFAGLFSGTGIAPPRSYALRFVTSF